MRAPKLEQLPVTIHMRMFDPSKDKLRLYALHEQMTLFGAPELLIEWGRLGHRQRLRVERFESKDMLDKRKRELIGRRRRHGYVDVHTA